MRQNEFFEKLLSEAVPTTFENKQHFISSSRCYLNLDTDILGIIMLLKYFLFYFIFENFYIIKKKYIYVQKFPRI